MKFFLALLVMAISTLWAAQPFKEQRYIYSIDKHLALSGTIAFEAKQMEIRYTEPQIRRIVYDGDSMDTYDHDILTQHIDLSSQPMMQLYMRFIFELYQGNFKALEESFNTVYEGDTVRLTPIPPADKVITSVEVIRPNKVISKIMTKMSNGDEIRLDIAP